MKKKSAVVAFVVMLAACKQAPGYDIIIRNGLLYVGNGGEPYKADIGINAVTNAFIGDLRQAKAKKVRDTTPICYRSYRCVCKRGAGIAKRRTYGGNSRPV
ncbi:MAG: hypothetical protein ABI813_10910 [Bacteroidota bacterium]